MTNRGFGAASPRELLDRASFEIQELKALVDSEFNSEQEARHSVGSRAAACVASLWSIVDWLEKSMDPAVRAALAVAQLDSPKAVDRFVKASCPELRLCWELTNGYKHTQFWPHLQKALQLDAALLSAPPMPHSSQRQRYVPKAITQAGDRLHVTDICDGALKFWRTWFKGIGL